MLRKQGKRELARGQMPGQLPSAGCLDRAAGGPHLLAGCSRGGRRFFGGTERQAAQLQPLGTIRLVACTRSVMTVPRKLRERFWASGSHFCLEPENVLAKKADLHEHFKLRCAERGWVSATTSPPAGRPAARCGSRNRTRRAGLRTVRRPVSLPHLSPEAVSSANLVSTRQQSVPADQPRYRGTASGGGGGSSPRWSVLAGTLLRRQLQRGTLPPVAEPLPLPSYIRIGRRAQLAGLDPEFVAPMDFLCEELRQAASTGECDRIVKLLDLGAKPDGSTWAQAVGPMFFAFHSTALVQAVSQRQTAAVELLLQRGRADPSLACSSGITPLMAASKVGDSTILQLLLTAADDRRSMPPEWFHAMLDATVSSASAQQTCGGLPSGFTAFHFACEAGHRDCAVELARAGCSMQVLCPAPRVEANTSYFEYASVRSLQIAKETQKTPNFGTISKQMGSEYRELSVAEKQPYVDKAAKAKSKYVKVTAAYEKLKADGQAAGGYTGKNLAECGGHQAVVSGLRALVLEQMKNRMMLAAAKEGDCDKLRELFDDGGVAHNMDALVKCEDLGEETIYTTVLLQAVKSDRHDVVQLLLDRKVDLNAAEGVKRPWNPRCGETPLIAAAARGHLHILETLLKHEPDIEAVDHREHGQETAYHKACSSGHADCAVALARAGCDTEYVNGDLMTGTTLADSNGHSEVLDKLRAMVLEQLQMSRDPNASHHAIVRHHEQLATEFLVRDSINDKIGLMYRLLKAGADPDKVVRLASLCIEVTDSYPFEEATPLMAAAFSGRHSAIQLLLEYEADINLKIEEYYSSGHSAFHCACYAGQTECAVALLNAGCDTSLLAPSEKLDEGLKTGWDMARENGHETLIEQCKKAQDGPRATLPSEADETERTKRATANRKKKARKKAKKAALLSSHSESEPAPEPEPEADMDIRALAESTPNSDTIVESHAETGSEAQPEPEPQPDAEGEVSGHDDTLSCVPTAVHVPTVSLQVESQLNKPELDERAHQLHALAELSVHQWSATQVLEWIVLIDLPPEGASAVSTVMESLDLDGEELLDLGPKILQKKLVKYGTPDAEVLAKQVLAQRDALLQPEDDTFSDNHDDLTATMNVLMMKEREANHKLMQHRAQALKARDQGFNIPVRRVGDIECETRKTKLHSSVPVEGALGRSSLQSLTVSNWHPMRVIVADSTAIEVINEEDGMLQQIEAAYPGMRVGEFILAVWQELQDFNPSGGYTVEIPWNVELGRELTPAEVTAILMQGKGKKKKKKKNGRAIGGR